MSPVTQRRPADGGTPKEALEEFVRAVEATGPGPDPRVATAFAAGWHAADAVAAAGDDTALELPRALLRADVAKLAAPLAAARQDVAGLEAAIAGDAETLAPQFASRLTAADYRLGKAFNLGCRIGRLREAAPADGFAARAFADRLAAEHAPLRDWLSQLATALPPNAGHSVRDSLDIWAAALAGGCDLTPLRAADVRAQLESWRTLLSGEKAGRDALELTDYVSAAEGVADELGRVVRRALARFAPWIAAALALIVAGVVLTVLLRRTAGVTAGLATIVATLGVSWKAVGGSLGRALAKVEQPAWAAQVDRAIAFAITRPLPSELLGDAPRRTLLWQLRQWRRHA
jgi:hypothetical protein